ncbi:MAG: outer membrane protein assembly factor [Xanthomonadales bacterium]|nr:outer membrane protein assembly factor [Xanthomonadales bacterium]
MRRSLIPVLLSAWLLAGSPLEARQDSAPAPTPVVEVRVTGLDEAMLQSATQAIELRALGSRKQVSPALVRRLHEQAAGEIARSLEAFGYYQVKVDGDLQQVGERFVATYQVDPGPPTRVVELVVDTGGVAAENRRVARVVERFRPRLSEVLRHPTYEDSKSKVFQALLSEGYLEAEVKQARVEVVRARNEADIQLVYQPGPRYALGETRFVGSQVDTARLARLIPYQPGEEYRLNKLLTLQRRLVDTGYFSVVDVAPDVDDLGDGRVPIEVRLEPTARTEYRAGVFFGTDSGPGIRGSMERRWLNQRGDQGRAEFEFSDKLKYGAIIYTRPLDRPGRPLLQAKASWSDRVTDSSESRQKRLSVSYIGDWRGWKQNLSMNLLDGDFEVGGESGSSTLLYPSWELARSTLRPAGDPSRGHSLSLTLRGAPSALGSDTDFLQLLAKGRYVRPMGKGGHKLILKADLGATYVDDFDQLPPELRFFAGGDRSLRGFSFQELGPENDAGKVRGGPYLATVSAEYERRISDPWAVAAFVDAGNAFDTGQFDPVVSVGAGVRWRGPVGLVRLDLGVGVSEEDTPLRLHLIIGGEL